MLLITELHCPWLICIKPSACHRVTVLQAYHCPYFVGVHWILFLQQLLYLSTADVILKQCFSHWSLHPNHLQGLLRLWLLNPPPELPIPSNQQFWPVSGDAVAADPPTTTYTLWEPLLQSYLAKTSVLIVPKQKEGCREIAHFTTTGDIFYCFYDLRDLSRFLTSPK